MSDPNGSDMVPQKIGNTCQTSAGNESKKRGNAMKGWILTLKARYGSNGAITEWIKQYCECAVWQLEKGETTGYVHYQITLTLKKKNRLTWLKNHFQRTVHGEIINNHERAFEYSQKEDTRVSGPYYWPEPIQPVQDPLEGIELYDWQKELKKKLENKPDDREIMWYFSREGRTGKSKFAKHLYLTMDGVQVCCGKKNDIYHALNQNLKILIVDIPRSQSDYMKNVYTIVEEVKNGMVFSGKYESRIKVFDPPHVIVFANEEPDYDSLSCDRWCVMNIDP